MTDTVLIEEGPSPRIVSLIKFIKHEYVDAFRSGQIRMGSVRSYRELYDRDRGGRNDPKEHLGSIIQSDYVQMAVTINKIVVGDLAGPVEVRPNIDDISYLLCMTAITDRSLNAAGGNLRLDPRLLDLGGAAVIVRDVGQFQKRLEASIHAIGFLRSHAGQDRRSSGLVEYIDISTYHGDVGPFKKSKDFAFQQEWRLALIDSREKFGNDHIFLELGDLSDITISVASKLFLSTPIRILPQPGADRRSGRRPRAAYSAAAFSTSAPPCA